MSQSTSMGTCGLCGNRFGRAAMTRHLKTCNAKLAPAPAKPRSNGSFHLFVEARYAKAYWMHLAVPSNVALSRLDAFLRSIWLECCGHLSAFTIGESRYVSAALVDLGDGDMEVRLGALLQPGTTFSYEYDFGSTTELKLKVVDIWDGAMQRPDVKLLARNDAPEVACDRCGIHPATQICTDCDQAWFCESCAEAHECGTEMCLPVVNSPRAGVCGYAG